MPDCSLHLLRVGGLVRTAGEQAWLFFLLTIFWAAVDCLFYIISVVLYHLSYPVNDKRRSRTFVRSVEAYTTASGYRELLHLYCRASLKHVQWSYTEFSREGIKLILSSCPLTIQD